MAPERLEIFSWPGDWGRARNLDSTSAMPSPKSEEGGWTLFLISGLFALSVFALVYWGYPFDGMVMEESWHWYGETAASNGSDLSWSSLPGLLVTRRGGYHLVHLLIVALGSTPVFINALAVIVQAVNLGLFAWIVWQLGGAQRVFPVLAAALLYPFASGAHFWQILLIHHLAILVFLISLALFLRLTWSGEWTARRVLLCGLPSLACFWLSLSLMEHATLLPVLFLYLALYDCNGRTTFFKFAKWRSPAVGFALCYLAMSGLFIGLMFQQGHPRLNFLSSAHALRFKEWAAAAYLPTGVVTALVLGASAALFLLSALLSNSIGYLLYPVMTVAANLPLLDGTGIGLAVAVGLVAWLGVYGLFALNAARARPGGTGKSTASPAGLLMMVGFLWAFLAYLPMASSFAYPTIVGQIADRVNILALFGVSLCMGLIADRVVANLLRGGRLQARAGFLACCVIASILLLNLCLQRAYWVEGYLKERSLVSELLAGVGQEQFAGRRPILFLDRAAKPDPIRVRLHDALETPGLVRRTTRVAKVILARHFTEAGAMEVTSFHLQGIPLFGGNHNGAESVFRNYSRLLSLPSVPAYKREYGFSCRMTAEQLLIEYDDFLVRAFPRTDYVPVLVRLDESYFRFRGPASYQLQPIGEGLCEQAPVA